MSTSTDMLEFYDLSHPWGFQAPNWPYFQDVSIKRIHYMAKSGVLTQKITTTMHSTTHIDAPAHVVENSPFIDEIPLEKFFGTGVVVSIPKGPFEQITAEDLENATPKIQPGDIVIINTGWHKHYGDNQNYFGRCPGLVPSAAHWMVEKGIKVVGHDTQANDHPLATAIGPHGPGGGRLMPAINKEYEALTGRKVIEDFPEWEPVHRILFTQGILGIENVGGDIDKVTGKRCTFSFFPWRWTRGDGCIIRLVAILDPTGNYRVEKGA